MCDNPKSKSEWWNFITSQHDVLTLQLGREIGYTKCGDLKPKDVANFKTSLCVMSHFPLNLLRTLFKIFY